MKIRGNGKLLISGEYLVLKGAEAFALPTKLGQELLVESGDSDEIRWLSFEKSTCFLECSFDLKGNAKSKAEGAETQALSKILKAVLSLRKEAELDPLSITSTIEFNRNWGLGSSSTLIYCLSQLFELNPFELLRKTFGGSGYDIACAQTDAPIIYSKKDEKPNWRSIKFNPSFKNNLFFVYLNKKMNSRLALSHFHVIEHRITKTDIETINSISKGLVESQSIKEFSDLIISHENHLSKVLEMPMVKNELFSDYPNAVKSLGAWGGDFVLALGDESEMTYFRNKGYEVIVSYDDMILTKEDR